MLDSLSLKNTKLGTGDARADGLPAEPRPARPQPRRLAGRASPTTTSRDRRPHAGRDRSRAIVTFRARSTRAIRSCARKRAPSAAKAFRDAGRACTWPPTPPQNGRVRGGASRGRDSDGAARATLHAAAGRLRRHTARSVRRAQEPRPPGGDRRARAAALQRGMPIRSPLRERVLDGHPRPSSHQEPGLSRDDRDRVAAELTDDILGHGPLERLLADDSVTEIMVNGPWRRLGRAPGAAVRDRPCASPTTRTCAGSSTRWSPQVGRRIDESSPMVDARLPDGSRVNAIIPPLSPVRAAAHDPQVRRASGWTLDDMVRLGTLSTETVEFLQRCVQAELNILISGGTGAGKTTLLNALSTAIPDSERIVTIEDAAELRLNQRHVLRLEARPKNIEGEGEIPIRELVRNSLRMRPDRIIVGEVRGAEALDMLQAMNTGHDGSLSTVHANSPARRAGARRDDGADGRLRPAAARDPPAGGVGARPDRPPRAAGGRLAPRHLDHRGAADGVRRDHAAGALRVQDRRGDAATARSSAACSRPGCGRRFLHKFEKRGVDAAARACSRRRPRARSSDLRRIGGR